MASLVAMVCTQETALPQLSVAVHVRVKLTVRPHGTEKPESVYDTDTAEPHASVAVGVPVVVGVKSDRQGSVMLELGSELHTGGIVSRIEIGCV